MTVDEVKNTAADEGRRRRRRSRKERAAESKEVNEQVARKERPTPSRREKAGRGNIITRTLRPVTQYLGDTRSELQKVTWPSREETLRLSGIVLAVTVISSIALGILDYLYGELFRLGFDNEIIFVIFAVVLAALVGGGTVLLRRRSGL